MTSKISLFNFGIFKTTLKRFMWGSVAYFAILFMSTCFPIMMEEESALYLRYIYYNEPMLFCNDYIAFPALTALVVPIVVSLLIFRFIHSKNQNIFTHSLPVSRGANYFSSLLAGFVLMAVPVILNGFALFILRFSYSSVIRIYHCAIWTAIILFVLFVMFSIAAFASVITGNSFMAVFLYGLINFLPLIIVGIIQAVGVYFVSGFPQNSIVSDFTIEYTPVLWIMNNMIGYNINENTIPIICYIVMAVLFYITTYILYRIRKSEKTGEVAAFRCINPMLKYLITTGTVIIMYMILKENYNVNYIMYAVFLLITTAVAYFACEMVLRKSVRVFKSYKGYIGFWIVSIAVVAVISLTGCFGYSNRVPDKEDVKTVTAYTYNEDGYSSMPEAIDYIIDLHNEIKGTSANTDYTRLNIKYELKNGSVMKRMYSVPSEKGLKVERDMYSFEDYKKRYNTALNIEAEEINNIIIYYWSDTDGYDLRLSSKKDIREFMEILKAETETLTYDQVYNSAGDYVNVEFEINGSNDVPSATMFEYFNMSKYHKKSREWIDQWRKNNS